MVTYGVTIKPMDQNGSYPILIEGMDDTKTVMPLQHAKSLLIRMQVMDLKLRFQQLVQEQHGYLPCVRSASLFLGRPNGASVAR